MLLGQVYHRIGQLPQAIDQLKVANWCRETAAGRLALASALLDSGDTSGARIEARRALVLEETRCPTRFYLPRADVRMDRLERTTTHTHCPYKGDASYWTVRVGARVAADAAWSYDEPLPEREDIRGHLCFYASRVDAFLVDGRPLAR